MEHSLEERLGLRLHEVGCDIGYCLVTKRSPGIDGSRKENESRHKAEGLHIVAWDFNESRKLFESRNVGFIQSRDYTRGKRELKKVNMWFKRWSRPYETSFEVLMMVFLDW
jgi:hypothetical protein